MKDASKFLILIDVIKTSGGKQDKTTEDINTLRGEDRDIKEREFPMLSHSHSSMARKHQNHSQIVETMRK